SLDSNAFQVVTGGANVIAARVGTNIQATLRYDAPKGWRLMDMNLMSNRPIPVRNTQTTVELLDGSDNVLGSSSQVTDGNGIVSVANNASAVKVRVTDPFGNVGTA